MLEAIEDQAALDIPSTSKADPALHAILFPTETIPVAHEPNEDTRAYLHKCSQNILAEIWGLYKRPLVDRIYIEIRNNRVYGIWKDHEMLESIFDELSWNIIIYNGCWSLLRSPTNKSFEEFPPLDLLVGRRMSGRPTPQMTMKSGNTSCLVEVSWVGYVRPYYSDYRAILDGLAKPSSILQDLAKPQRRSKFQYKLQSSSNDNSGVPINDAQLTCIHGLSHTIEGIQGPPGTGKSTTIYHIIRSVPHVCIVTCVQNKAIDAIAEKLATTSEDLPFVVVGRPKNLGVISRNFLLEQQIGRHEDVMLEEVNILRAEAICSFLHEDLCWHGDLIAGDPERASLKKRDRSLWQRLWVSYVKSTDLWSDYQRWCDVLVARQKSLPELKLNVEKKLISSCRAFLCTVDSLVYIDDMIDNYADKKSAQRKRIAIIDEAGTVPEYKIPKLVSYGVLAVVAIGDQRQLKPFSISGTNDGFFHRITKAIPVPMLNEQYRMHPRICDFVSRAFYDNKLKTPSILSRSEGLIIWKDHLSSESLGKSKSNAREVKIIMKYLNSEGKALLAEGRSIMVITFYKQQFKDLIAAATAAGLSSKDSRTKEVRFHDGLRIVTVDAAQGSEADIVILSCVRSNNNHSLGFITNSNRMCVSMSRARERLIVVGNSQLLQENKIWRMLRDCAQVESDS
jgi:hypothetical protein